MPITAGITAVPSTIYSEDSFFDQEVPAETDHPQNHGQHLSRPHHDHPPKMQTMDSNIPLPVIKAGAGKTPMLPPSQSRHGHPGTISKQSTKKSMLPNSPFMRSGSITSMTPAMTYQSTTKRKGGGGGPMMKEYNNRFGSLANMDEITRITGQMDAMKIKLRAYEEERKTMKMIFRQQDLALKRMDKEQAGFPQVIQNLSDELRLAKNSHAEYVIKLMNAEKTSKSYIEEILRLQAEVAKAKSIMKARNLEDNDVLKKQVEKLKQIVDEKDVQIAEFNRKLKHIENSRNMEARALRHENQRMVVELDKLRADCLTYQTQLEAKTRFISSLMISAKNQLGDINSNDTHQGPRHHRKHSQQRHENGPQPASKLQETHEDSASQQQAQQQRHDEESDTHSIAPMGHTPFQSPMPPEAPRSESVPLKIPAHIQSVEKSVERILKELSRASSVIAMKRNEMVEDEARHSTNIMQPRKSGSLRESPYPTYMNETPQPQPPPQPPQLFMSESSHQQQPNYSNEDSQSQPHPNYESDFDEVSPEIQRTSIFKPNFGGRDSTLENRLYEDNDNPSPSFDNNDGVERESNFSPEPTNIYKPAFPERSRRGTLETK
ncbi:hypothetical protein HDU76_000895 [Blyttiomyces sp. JEL0837]|nr:hypothetical protein HDU76_000895 [Blyttiomyces sp. JEL0837]